MSIWGSIKNGIKKAGQLPGSSASDPDTPSAPTPYGFFAAGMGRSAYGRGRR